MRTLIYNVRITNEGKSFRGSVVIEGKYIADIIPGDCTGTHPLDFSQYDEVIDASSFILIPGVIDDQVHFREPGATYKGDIRSESAAAALGGVTTFMDMPNNNPPAVTLPLLEAKYDIAARQSYTNYSFYLGADNSNIEEIIGMNPNTICGVKVFMGSSTGNMLVDNPEALERIFRDCPTLIATHCEEEEIIAANLKKAVEKYGAANIPVSEHPLIRSREACITSTKKAIALALKYNSRLHILHVTTAEEVKLLREAHKLNPKITYEICTHYLLFCDKDYEQYGTLIKCNPAIKVEKDMIALRRAISEEDALGAVATDHAPHLFSEKNADYLHSPSGLPSVQHSLRIMLKLANQGIFSIEQVVKLMCHAPAETFGIKKRGYIRKGYYADIVLLNPDNSNDKTIISKNNIAYKCGWSPLEGTHLPYTIEYTIINGVLTVKKGVLTGDTAGERVEFNKD